MSIVRYGRFCRASIAWPHAATGWPNSARFAGTGAWGRGAGRQVRAPGILRGCRAAEPADAPHRTERRSARA
jgi:hypothetical protein